jgi:hypothetical protein
VIGGVSWVWVRLAHHVPFSWTDQATLLGLGGLVAWLLLTVLAVALVPVGTRKARAMAVERLRQAVTVLARERVAGPARDVLVRYAQAREALQAVQRREA